MKDSSSLPERNEGAKLALVIPTYNRFGFLCEALNSYLNQSAVPGWETFAVVVDDGSTDQTAKLVRETYSSQIAAGKLFVLEVENGERGRARNTGANFAIQDQAADWVLFLDADDLLAPQSLTLILPEILPSSRMAAAKYQVLESEKLSALLQPASPPLNADLNILFLNSNPLALGSTLMRADIFVQTRGFPEDRDVTGSEDWILLWRASYAARGHLQFIEKSLVWYRRHEGNTSIEKTRRSMELAREAVKNFVNEYFAPKAAWAQKEMWVYHSLCLAGACNAQRKPGQALREIQNIFMSSPLSFFDLRLWRVVVSSTTKMFGL